MVHGMISNGMPFRRHAFDQFGLMSDKAVENKETSRDLLLLEGIEDFLHARIPVPCVESQVGDLFRVIRVTVAVVDIVAVELFDEGQLPCARLGMVFDMDAIPTVPACGIRDKFPRSYNQRHCGHGKHNF